MSIENFKEWRLLLKEMALVRIQQFYTSGDAYITGRPQITFYRCRRGMLINEHEHEHEKNLEDFERLFSNQFNKILENARFLCLKKSYVVILQESLYSFWKRWYPEWNKLSKCDQKMFAEMIRNYEEKAIRLDRRLLLLRRKRMTEKVLEHFLPEELVKIVVCFVHE